MSTQTQSGTAYTMALLLSYVEAGAYRLRQAFRPRPATRNGDERRQNPRSCVLCGGPMRSDRRPPRDVRGPNGQIRRLPEEVLHWHRCARCHGSQVGVQV